MSGNIIGLKPVGELSGEFVIPDYQRGYRWTRQEVKDLLDDINEFTPEKIEGKGKDEETFYCLQPLVVQWKEEEQSYEVIDGQQRLTTIFIILKYLERSLEESQEEDMSDLMKEFLEMPQKYCLTYKTREGSKMFLESLGSKSESIHVGEKEIKPKDNIDFFHMDQAYKTIEDWFNAPTTEFAQPPPDKGLFLRKLFNNVKFVWYEPEEDNSIKVFTRMNTGKIPLTNAELVKALFLNQSNFNDNEVANIQRKIASSWYEIEYKLQNDEFWSFLHDYEERINYTRINFIFDIICNDDRLKLGRERLEKIEIDKYITYRTFRYFYEYFKSKKEKRESAEALEIWDEEIKDIDQRFDEWYGNIEQYNYIGYLTTCCKQKQDIVLDLLRDHMGKDKNSFFECLISRIKKEVADLPCLDEGYEIGKTKDCKPLLLLHNIQTKIDAPEGAERRFEFHLYKAKKWDVEHIDSFTPNKEDKKEDQIAWLRGFLEIKDLDASILKAIEDFCSSGKDSEREDFETVKNLLPKPKERLLGEEDDDEYGNEKNQIMNLTLLDSSTNRSYKNVIFARKRLILKERKEEEESKKGLSTGGHSKAEHAFFIPICTQKVFWKHYEGSETGDLRYWYKKDAEAYKKDIYNKLHDRFGIKLTKNNKQ